MEPDLASPLTVDLRSDVLGRPTPQMWEAMESCEIGLYDFDEDPTVHALEQEVAHVAGKQAGFFVVTGRIANILALMTLAGDGRPLVRERRSHLGVNEAASLASVLGLTTYDVEGDLCGTVRPEHLAEVVEDVVERHEKACVVALENTHSIAGGCALTPEETATLASTAREQGARYVYLDGARLWNAAVATAAPVEDFLAPVDAAMLSLSKGVGAPFGAVLVGSFDFVERARQNAHLIGAYSVHRMGYLAAAALVALETRAGRLEEDHRRARMLAEGLAAVPGLRIEMRTVQTNLVRVEVTHPGIDAPLLVEELAREGVGASVIEPPRSARFALYSDITDEDVNTVVRTAERVLTR